MTSPTNFSSFRHGIAARIKGDFMEDVFSVLLIVVAGVKKSGVYYTRLYGDY
jgi:hypothetical protein